MKRIIIFLTIVFVVNLIFTMLVFPVHAQDNIAAGLFCEARQLPVVSHGIDVRVHREDATVTVEQVFYNDGPEIAQADYRMHLPAEAVVTEFGFWNQGKYLKATLKAKEEAKAAHAKAASEGRTTGILHKESDMQQFSVYPLPQRAHKRVRIQFIVPVISELGKNHLRIPVDSFLGQESVTGIASVRIDSDRQIAQYGVEGAMSKAVGQTDTGLRMMVNVNQPFELWWKEAAVPLTMTGAAVKLADDTFAVELRVAMDELKDTGVRPKNVHVFMDGSFSMRQKLADAYPFLARLKKSAEGRVAFYVAGDRVVAADSESLEKTFEKIATGQYGHRMNWARVTQTLKREKCHQWENQCIIVTDLTSLDEAIDDGIPAEMVWLADVHEKAYYADKLSDRTVHVVEADPVAKLVALADELLLPVIEIKDVASLGHSKMVPSQKSKMAMGGRLSLFGEAKRPKTLSVEYAIDGKFSKNTDVELVAVAADSEAGKQIRKGYYRAILASMMQAYRESPDASLKERIVEISLREEIPTAFTSLQVDDPSLNIFSMKPGDPILTVHHEPGVESVVAAYPFGDVKNLLFSKTTDTWTDRFLVPRGWGDQSYRVAVFKRFSDGRVKREYTYYQIDRVAPAAAVSIDEEHGLLTIEPEAAGAGIGSVQVHLSNRKTLDVTPVDGRFMVETALLTARAELRIRDRAGNMTRFVCTKSKEEIECAASEGKRVKSVPAAVGQSVPVIAAGKGLQVSGDVVSAQVKDRKIAFSLEESKLRSIVQTAFTEAPDGTFWIGTQLGDLVHVTCHKGEACAAVPVSTDFYGHAITGIVARKGAPIIIAVIGKGMYQIKNGKPLRYRVRAKSRYATSLVDVDGTMYYGTLRNGLYQIVDGVGRPIRLPEDTVIGLSVVSGKLVVDTPGGQYVQVRKNRFVKQGQLKSYATDGPDTTAAVTFKGATVVAGFNGGLMSYKNGQTKQLDLQLSVMARRINALAVYNETLYLATEDGLFKTDDLHKVEKTRISGSVHDLAVGPAGMAVATSRGLYVVSGKMMKRIDFQVAGKGRFSCVAFWNNKIVAGNIDGLYWFDKDGAGQVGAAEGFDTTFVTALLEKNGILYVGTYDDGVYASRKGHFVKVTSLKKQWVPPHGLKWINGELWVGGMGMPLKHGIPGKKMEAVHVPVRDVNDFFATPNGVLLLTSDGTVMIENHEK